MTIPSRVRAVLAVLVLTVVGVTGCVQVPTAGPIEKVSGQSETCQNCINVEVAPPAPGDEPPQVVEGYLRAMSNYQPNYATARQFLTVAAAGTWRPEAGVGIYRGSASVDQNRVRLVGQLVGNVGPDRTYAAADRKLDWDFGLVRENGEWRISRPPNGLMVAQFAFDRFYTGYSTFFIGNGTSLVPERIYLPALRNPANVASALMTALLDGPSAWVDPAVGSAIPMGTSLSVDSVTISNGIAEVSLNESVLALADPQRSLMAAQIVYTLRQIPAVKGVLITVNQQRYRVPGADPNSLVVAVDALSREIDPVPFVSDQLYAVRNGLVHQVTTPDGSPSLQVVSGPLGRRDRFPVDSLAVSVNGTDLAVVTDGRRTLRRATTATGEVTTLDTGLTSLLRPQFTRYGEIWAIGRKDGKQRFWLSSPGLPTTVTAPVLNDGEITAFRISPDGTRIALVRQTAAGAELGLARIIRAEKVVVDAWRPIDLRQSESAQVTRIADVAWVDANDLLVLGAPSQDAALVAVRVAADASQVSVEGGDPTEWNARELTVLSRPQSFIVVGQGNQTWRKNGGPWVPYLSDVTTVAYAG
ncbi:MAG TPA: LpqB family beta-propeller domain-containing protein [Propionibacteriaceae bacterium]|nr:LpqB family beta-propeller domain-containing protein [Propionibacteriaceae bacterium]